MSDKDKRYWPALALDAGELGSKALAKERKKPRVHLGDAVSMNFIETNEELSWILDAIIVIKHGLSV